MTGSDVEQWQQFLTGLKYNPGGTDGTFGPQTQKATAEFQSREGLGVDGAVGRDTLAKAIAMGFGDIQDDGVTEETGSAWPAKPSFPPASGKTLFGTFAFTPAPVPGNPEAITITDGWATKNIAMVVVPQLKGVAGGPSNGKIPFNVRAAAQLQDLWTAWEAAGLLPLILSWGGSWAPRFIRGSRTVLSNHAWGSAFDINYQWNGLGTQPALVDQPGSVRKLVQLANDNGFFWGGHFGGPFTPGGRPDGMHFEIAYLK